MLLLKHQPMIIILLKRKKLDFVTHPEATEYLNADPLVRQIIDKAVTAKNQTDKFSIMVSNETMLQIEQELTEKNQNENQNTYELINSYPDEID